MTDLLMGIPGLDVVQPGTHVCALFSGPAERDSLILQFMQEGLRHGDQCVCLIDELEPSSMHEKAYEPAELGDSRRSGRFDLYSAPDAYIGGGELSRKQRISGLVSPPTSPEDNWFPVLRAAGQMSRSAYEPGAREFSAYESAVILILAQVPTVFLCLYDMQRFGVGVLAEVLKVHSRVLLDGIVLNNPHCVIPPPYPDRASGALPRHPVTREPSAPAIGGDQWRSLTGSEVRVAELVGTGLTNRATADMLIVSPHTVDAHLKHIYQKLGIHSRAELAVLSFRHGPPTA